LLELDDRRRTIGMHMQTLTQHVIIPPDHKLHLDLALPTGTPTGPADLLVIVQPKSKEPAGRVLGLAVGKVQCTDDFDEPLGDGFWMGEK
jgi:hypothetical protein